MIYDVLDLLNPKPRFTAEGTYWEQCPDSSYDGGQKFNYEFVDPFSRTYRRLFGNIQSFEAGETSIRSNDCIGFKVGGFVMTADGQMFRIIQVGKDYSAAQKQVMRIFGTPLSTEYVLRLVTHKNQWGAR